jgi:hypothetical protein
MTKFEELCSLFSENMQAYHEYEKEAWALAEKIKNKMVQYLGIPADQREEDYLKTIPPGNYNLALTYTIPGSVHLEDDGFWHFGLVLVIRESPKVIAPIENVLIHLKFKLDHDKYQVFWGADQSIAIESDTQIDTLVEKLFALLKNRYENYGSLLYKELNSEKSGVKAYRVLGLSQLFLTI